MIFRISKIHTLIALLLISFHALDNSIFVYSFPSGAGSCNGGIAPVGGFHLAKGKGKKVKSSNFSDKAVNVTIGGITVMPGEVITLASNTLHMINVTSSGMQGTLVRVETPKGVKTTGVLMPGSSTHAATVCIDPIVGITHKTPSLVTNYDGTINFPSPTDGVLFDITVVFSASSSLSEYAYGNFTVNFVSSEPAAMIISKPIGKPVSMPVSKPLSMSGVKPVSNTVGKPISMPVAKPSKAAAATPVSKPVAATPVSKPATKSRTTDVEKPVVKPVGKSFSKPITKSIGKPILKEDIEKVDAEEEKHDEEVHDNKMDVDLQEENGKAVGDQKKPIIKKEKEEVDAEEEKHNEKVHDNKMDVDLKEENGKAVGDQKKPIIKKETNMATKNNS